VRVLVTGATGFIGTALVRRLIQGGDEVRSLVRKSSSTSTLGELPVEMVLGDLADEESLRRAVAGCELVYHLAGAVKALRPRDFFRVNGEGTRRVAVACAAAPTPPRLVYVSSLAAAGPSAAHRPRHEEDPERPVSLYGESKLEGERALRSLSGRMSASVVRPPIVYGPGDREFLPLLARMARLGLSVQVGLAERRYSTLHVDDLCEGLLAVARRGKPVRGEGSEGTYFLDDGAEHTWAEIGRVACAALGRRTVQLRLPIFLALAAAAVSSLRSALSGEPAIVSFDKLKEVRERAWTCSSDRARREVGYCPRFPLEPGLADALLGFGARDGGG
jgi:dihydroflavonol-4-reductase